MNNQSRGLYSSSCSSRSNHTYCSQNNNNNNLDQIFLLGENIPTTTNSSSSSASTACGVVGSLSLNSAQMPFSPSCYNTSAAAGNGFSGVGEVGGPYQGSFLAADNRGKSHLEQDLDSLDCDSEDGVGILEEAAKSALTRSSGSKRSRAAEVHNMSEKRRRSKINEKMKALQNLIPNSNKTDKASMLDEAIEYLKQLQLQVQMLSMRNGLSLHPMYLSGALHPLQAPEMCIGLGLDADIAMNIGTGILPLHHDAAAQSSSSILNHSKSAHQPTAMQGLANLRNSEASVMMESSQNHHGPFRLPLSHEEALTSSMVNQQHLVAAQSKRNTIGNAMSSLPINNPRQFAGQASILVEGCMVGRERPQEMQSDEPVGAQQLNG